MVIETERLILRPFTEEDAADVLEYLKKPAVNCFACMKLDSLDEANKKKVHDSFGFICVIKPFFLLFGRIIRKCLIMLDFFDNPHYNGIIRNLF